MARVVGIGSVGLGAYPTDSYFDPDRPSWLPYWIDDLTESDKKYNAANVMQATANAAGMATGQVVGSVANVAADAAGNIGSGLLGSLNLGGIAVVGVIGLALYGMYFRR